MPNTRKLPANTSNVLPASARPKVTVSAKENSSQPRLSTSTRPTIGSKPLGTQTSSSNGAKDAETAALVANLRAEIDHLKKLQAAKPMEENPNEIPRPTKITSLQDAMGLTGNRKMYFFCRSVVRDVIAHSGLPNDVDWRRQDAVVIGKVAQIATSRCKHLKRYKSNWATLEIMKTLIKNRRTYRHRIGPIDDEQVVKNEEIDVDVRDNEGSVRNSDMESMYAEDEKKLGSDEDDNGEDGEDQAQNGKDMYGGSDGGNDEDENDTKNINGSEEGADEEDVDGANIGGDEEDGNNAKINDSHGLPRGKDNRGSMKRKLKVTRDDEPSARKKRTKQDSSGGHQGATQLTKKAMPKRKSSKKKV